MIITTDQNKVSAIVENLKLNLIFNGDYYNTKNGIKKLTINTPIVEFYDACSNELVDRYYVSAIMAIPDNSGLNFNKSNDAWNISKENLDMIKNWLMQYKCSHTVSIRAAVAEKVKNNQKIFMKSNLAAVQ